MALNLQPPDPRDQQLLLFKPPGCGTFLQRLQQSNTALEPGGTESESCATLSPEEAMSFLNEARSVLIYRMDANNLQSAVCQDSKPTVQDHFNVPRSTMVRQPLLFWVAMSLGGMLFPYSTPRAGLEYYAFN